MPTPRKISDHLRDLGKRDIMVAYDCVQWLAPTQRELDRRSRPKRLANRYIAACMIVQAAEQPAFAKEVLDRTEGKVADKLITVDLNDMVRQLEAGRQRVLAHRTQELLPLDVVVESNDTQSETDVPALTVLESNTSK